MTPRRGVSTALVAEWFAQLRAPSKQLIWFEDSALMVYEEEPGKLLVNLVKVVRPWRGNRLSGA